MIITSRLPHLTAPFPFRWLPAAVSLLLIYLITSAGKTPYDYFLRLAQAFMHGNYWLSVNPSWLNELIPAGHKYFVAYPPMPAILLIPFLVLFGSTFQQQWLAHLLGVATALLASRLAQTFSKNKVFILWAFLFIGLGTINWYLSATGSVWFLGQISAEFFLTAALLESLTKKRPFVAGFLLGAAYLSRLQTILSLPFFLYQLRHSLRLRWQGLFAFLFPLSLFISLDMLYNYLRFGTIFDVAYYKIPGVLAETWFSQGLFNLAYIPRHLKILFGALPIFRKSFPFVTPSWAGLAIWLTSPAFIYALRASLREKENFLAWLAIIAISLLDFSHGSTGFAQFGYRFAADFYPFLFFLTLKGAGKNLAWHHWLLLGIGIFVNLWGVLWINKFGYVSY